MMPTLDTSGPQRQGLYGTSKGVNSSVGLCFFVATYRNDLISVGDQVISVDGHTKNTDQKKKEHFRGFLLP